MLQGSAVAGAVEHCKTVPKFSFSSLNPWGPDSEEQNKLSVRVPPPLILAAADYFVPTQIGAVTMGTRICAQILSGAGKAEWGSPREAGEFPLYRGGWRERATSLFLGCSSCSRQT